MRTRAAFFFLVGVAVSLVVACTSNEAPRVATRIVVTVPHEETALVVDGKPIEGKGKGRMFELPLAQRKPNRVTFAATWKPNNYTEITRAKTVEVTGGSSGWVNLTTEDPNDRVRIRYVPTPPEVMDAMIKLAGVTEGDVVYEPGCGDARITIAAVKAGARRGVGVDIDPERVAESRAGVTSAGLDDKVEIRLGDALDIKDLGSASVVFLYMGNEFDLLIRPILWKQLKVGARVVSHRFTMGDWKPDRTVYLTDVADDVYEIHLWTITEEIKRKAS